MTMKLQIVTQTKAQNDKRTRSSGIRYEKLHADEYFYHVNQMRSTCLIASTIYRVAFAGREEHFSLHPSCESGGRNNMAFVEQRNGKVRGKRKAKSDCNRLVCPPTSILLSFFGSRLPPRVARVPMYLILFNKRSKMRECIRAYVYINSD